MISVQRIVQIDETTLFETVLPIHHKRMVEYMRSSTKLPTNNKLYEVMDFIKDVTGISFSTVQMTDIMALYPMVRSTVAAFGCQDTQDREFVLGMLADFFLGTTWPTFGDEVDIDAFLSRLTKSAKAMGYA
jgi:hypothetical protein